MLVLVLFALLSISLTMYPSSISADSSGDQTGVVTETLIRHMNIMVEKFPEMEGKKALVQEQLSNGKMPRQACFHCHIQEKQGVATGQ
jgi:hypothetical protein